MKFNDAEVVMSSDSTFYHAFIKCRTDSYRHSAVAKAFKRLFPNEIGDERKIRALLNYYSKRWESHGVYDKSVLKPEPVATLMMSNGYVTGYGVTMSTPKLMETIHYVNGVDVRKLSDDQLITIIRDREMEIAKLNSTGKKPARLQKRANELQAELDALVTFLDGLDTTAA